jgi:hypothetical protein
VFPYVLRPPQRTGAPTRNWAGATPLATLALGLALASPAMAVPSFSDQTGDPCSACHVGAFGPQLTAYGRAFKLTGYTDGSRTRVLPLLSAMLQTSFTNTAKDQSGPAAPGFGANNNVAVDQISVFLAGRIYDHVGVFDQITWDGVGHAWGWDNLDLRYAQEFHLAGIDAILGATMNNNPTVTDPYNSTPAWGFPYASSPLALGPPGTMVEGGLAGRVIGGSVYGMFNDLIYAEAGAYTALPTLNHSSLLGVNPGDGPVVNGGAPYWRLALQDETRALSWEIGTFGLAANVYPANIETNATDNYLDLGFDFSVQYHKTKRNVFSLYGTAIRETATLNSSFATGGAAERDFNLDTFKLNGSYYYDQTYGLTLGLFSVQGSHDAILYAAGQDSGSRTFSPNANGYVIQIDWTPFGKEDSLWQPWANLRLALQYTGYLNFNGNVSNYDGFDRSAADNNTLYLLGWIAF